MSYLKAFLNIVFIFTLINPTFADPIKVEDNNTLPDLPKGTILVPPKQNSPSFDFLKNKTSKVKNNKTSEHSIPKVILWDTTHAQTAGQADWLPDGAYSDFADLFKKLGWKIITTDKMPITKENLKNIGLLILIEPNTDYSFKEREAIADFFKNGGHLLLIADHIGSDRNADGIDSIEILNKVLARCGIASHFNADNVFSNHCDVIPSPVTEHVKRVGIFAGCTIYQGVASGSVVISPAVMLDSKPILGYAQTHFGAKLVMVGDSSMFEDGSSSRHKKLHGALHSIMLNHLQLAYNIAHFFTFFPKDLHPKWLREEKEKEKFFTSPKERIENTIVVDTSLDNESVSATEVLRNLASSLKMNFKYASSIEFLPVSGIFLVFPPSKNPSEKWFQLVETMLLRGWTVVFIGNTSKPGMKAMKISNKILERFNIPLRFDGRRLKMKNKRRFWDFYTKIPNGFLHLWNATPIKIIKKCNCPPKPETLLIVNAPNLFLGDKKVENNKLPVIVSIPALNGKVVLCGSNIFTDYMLPSSKIYNQLKKRFPKSYMEPDVTEKFALKLLKRWRDFSLKKAAEVGDMYLRHDIPTLYNEIPMEAPQVKFHK